MVTRINSIALSILKLLSDLKSSHHKKKLLMMIDSGFHGNILWKKLDELFGQLNIN